MSYEDDLKKALAEYEAVLVKHEQARLEMEEQHETELSSLQQRVEALETLVRLSYPYPDGHADFKTVTPAQAHVAVIKPDVTQKIRRILTVSDEALTSSDLRAKLQRVGWKLSEASNPWALIHTICRNLVRQGFARPVMKGNRKAWERVKPVEKQSGV
jgi:hypothetical protein